MENEFESITKLCEHCGCINSSPRSKFCSKKCYNISYRENNKEKLAKVYKAYHRAHKAPVTKRVCEYCGELFTPRNGHQMYCTSNCRLTNWRLNNIEWNKEYGRQYREENKDKIKEYAETYREANRGKINKEYYKKYRETHKEKIIKFKYACFL